LIVSTCLTIAFRSATIWGEDEFHPDPSLPWPANALLTANPSHPLRISSLAAAAREIALYELPVTPLRDPALPFRPLLRSLLKSRFSSSAPASMPTAVAKTSGVIVVIPPRIKMAIEPASAEDKIN
jgi:hypothetical protein